MYLILGIVALLIGPIAYHGLNRWVHLRRGLELAVTIIVTGLALALLWDAAHHSNPVPVLVLGAAGFIIPLVAERLLHQKDEGIHVLTLIVGVAGLVLHAAADGAALLAGDANGHMALAIAVIGHRLPAGLGVWWLVRTEFGTRPAVLVLGLMAAATLIGYEAAALTLDLISTRAFAWFQAFVAGSLLHLAFHRLRHGDAPHAH